MAIIPATVTILAAATGRGHYSRADSMEHLREQINDMMRETDDDRVKEALRRAASLMEE